MLGQGRPSTPSRFARTIVIGHLARRSLGWAAARRILLAGIAWLLSVALANAEPAINLRVAWGFGERTRWYGTIEVDRGSLQLVRLLSEEPDTPGSIWEEQGRIEIREPALRQSDVIDIAVSAPIDAILNIQFYSSTEANAAPIVEQIPLRDLLTKPVNRELDRSKNRIIVRRLPADMLHIKPQHDHLVFSPRETLRFDVEPRYLPTSAGAALQMRARLVSASNGQEVEVKEIGLKATVLGTDPTTTSWEFKLPSAEGIYDVIVEALEQPAWRLAKAKQIAERRMQIVVIDDRAPARAATAAVGWSAVMEIDPANPAWYERFRSWSLFPNLRKGPLGNGGIQTWQHPKLGPMARLKEYNSEQEPYWEAYPLTITRPGAPHILEVEYPSDIPQSVGVSIVEPNAAGWVLPIGLDSGFFVPEEPADIGQTRMLRHRMVFWPRTGAPIALITNLGHGNPAMYAKIRVLSGPTKLPPMFPVAEPTERLLAGYMSRPLLAENFGGTETLDLGSGTSVDDWRSFYLGATRLTEYLQYVGYNAQMLNVYGEGSTIYPSRHLQSTPRYDTGESIESNQNPMRKDALEMTLRIFDREGLKLIPSLRFETPLPELEERLRRGGAEAEGILLIGADGRTCIETNRAINMRSPRYNPLNPHVQEAMLAVVRELAERYNKHPSFAGIAIELSSFSCTHLPGQAWGLDDDTMSRFQQATNLQLPGDGDDRFAQRAARLAPLTPRPGEEHEQWLKWRARVLADFYRRMQIELTSVRRDAVLYLAATDLLDGREAQEWLRPTLPPKARADELLLTLGLRPDLLGQDRGMVFLRPHRLLPPGSIADQGILASINQTPDLDVAFRRLPSAGSLLLHDPLWISDPRRSRLPSFDQKSLFGKDKTITALFSQQLPSERRNRERFVHALATLDAEAIFDGGWMLPLGQEESLTDLVAAYRRLPAGKFDQHPDSVLPITIRSQVVGNTNYTYFVNDSAWPMTLQVDVVAPAGTRVDELSGRRRLPALTSNGWQIQLEAFDFIAVRFSSAEAKIARANLLPNHDLQAYLSRKNEEFKQRLDVLLRPPARPVLANADFEAPTAGGQIPGWSLLNSAMGKLSIEGSAAPSKLNGKQALHFQSNGGLAVLRSDPITVPPSRRLTLWIWLRVDDPANKPNLNLFVEGENGYRASGAIPLDRLNKEWSPFIYPVDDLSVSGATQLRFGLEINGAGHVWIDNVEAFDLYYEVAERLELAQLALVTKGHLEKGRLGDCLSLVESYWPKYLDAYVPLPQGLAQQPNPNGQPGKPEEKTSRSTRPLDKLFKR